VAPVVRLAPEGAPLMLPFLFITIACGAISGFHSLVASGTSAKQLDSERDGRLVGYGGMVAEGILAVIAVLACVAGFKSPAAWHAHYASWSAAGGLPQMLSAFVEGGKSFIMRLGISDNVAAAFLGVVIVSFAMTTIDTATRLQRYVISELGGHFRVLAPLKNRYLAGIVAAGSALALAALKDGGKGGMALWPVFGTTNQLLAALALIVITFWLLRSGRPVIYTLLPMIFMLVMTGVAMLINIKDFALKARSTGKADDYVLAVVACAIFLLALWLVAEAVGAWRRVRAASPVELALEEMAVEAGPAEAMPPAPNS
jgi:carbon starvation protein